MSVSLLAIAYVAVAALLLSVWISTAWPTAVKIVLVLLVTLLYIGSYLGLREIQGWPTQQPLPDTFRLLWANMEEPDKIAGGEGRIFLWVRRLDATQRAVGQPRAYELPWNLALAEEVAEALRRTEAGEPLNGRLTRQPVKETTEERSVHPDQRAMDGDAAAITDLDEEPLRLEFSELPRVLLPAKGS